MKWFEMMLVLTVFALAVGCMGCTQAEKERQAVVDQGKAVFMKIADNAKIDTSELSADGELENPMYVYEWFGGTGIYSRGSVQVIGVKIGAKATGHGVGQAVPDQDLRDKIYQIMQRKDIADAERVQAVNAVIASWVAKKSAATSTAPESGVATKTEAVTSPPASTAP